jgi:hypothetical protein
MKKRLRKIIKKYIHDCGYHIKDITVHACTNGVLSLDIDFEEKQPKFKEGVWYKGSSGELYCIYLGARKGVGFRDNFWFENANMMSPELWEKADMSKVKELLLDKAKKDYPNGVKLKSVILSKIAERKKVFSRGIKFLYQNGCIIAQDEDCNSGGVTIFQNGQWAEKIEPIFYIGDKPMYEGDEYHIILFEDNWKLDKRIVSINKYKLKNPDKYFKRFLTKELALEYVLVEAKKRFENEVFHEVKGFSFNCFDRLVDGSRCLWNPEEGWVAEPIKEQLLMLGNEVVEIKTFCADPFKGVEGHSEIHCKGESVTKQEWLEWYAKFREGMKHYHYFELRLCSFLTTYHNNNYQEMTIGCIGQNSKMPDFDQIEAITKRLNEL